MWIYSFKLGYLLSKQFHSAFHDLKLILVKCTYPWFSFVVWCYWEILILLDVFFVEFQVEDVQFTVLLTLFWCKDLDDEIVQKFEFLGLIVSFLEIQKPTIRQHQESLLPFVKHTITLFPYHSRFQKLDHRVFDNWHGILFVDWHDLVLKCDICLFRSNQFVHVISIKIEILILFKLSENIFGTDVFHSLNGCSLSCKVGLFSKSFLVLLDLVFLCVLIDSFLAICLLLGFFQLIDFFCQLQVTFGFSLNLLWLRSFLFLLLHVFLIFFHDVLKLCLKQFLDHFLFVLQVIFL